MCGIRSRFHAVGLISHTERAPHPSGSSTSCPSCSTRTCLRRPSTIRLGSRASRERSTAGCSSANGRPRASDHHGRRRRHRRRARADLLARRLRRTGEDRDPGHGVLRVLPRHRGQCPRALDDGDGRRLSVYRPVADAAASDAAGVYFERYIHRQVPACRPSVSSSSGRSGLGAARRRLAPRRRETSCGPRVSPVGRR
jgi:hypothetical protein